MADDGLRNWRLWGIVALAVVLRVAPLLLFPEADCTRDECIYETMANKIVEGEGLTTSRKGWLAAPGYPYLLAFSIEYLGAVRRIAWLQILLTVPMVWIMYRLGARVTGSPRGAWVAALLFAVHPTFVFFAGTMWTETFYSCFLIAATLSMLWAREGPWWRAALSGLFIGFAMLFRGAALFLAPLFMLALVWPVDESVWEALRRRVRHAAALGLAAFLCVAPYSIHASQRHGGFLVTDATIGHVMYLGNNTFDPLTFDYGNGMLTARLYGAHLRRGRRPCRRDVPPVQSNACEVGRAVTYIRQRPIQFVRRIPLRMAQLFNPNSFFTRHLRWGYWRGLPWLAKEFLVLSIIGTTVFLTLGGSLVAWARARGPFGVAALGTIGYHVGTIALVYGMTRFRLPLEPFLILYVTPLLIEPRQVWRELSRSWWRMLGAAITVAGVSWLMSWFLLTGYPGLWR